MDIKELLVPEKVDRLKELFVSKRPEFNTTTANALKQFDVTEHDVHNKSKRKPKIIKKDSGNLDDNGKPILQTVMIDVARVAIPFQKLIVERRIGFMLSTPVDFRVTSENEDDDSVKKLLTEVKDIQDDNKMDYKNKEIARRLMSEMEVAEVWYLSESDTEVTGRKFDLRMKILSPELGDTLYPLFDEFGDMIAFARGYKVKDQEKNPVEHLDVYTKEFEYQFINQKNAWILNPDIPVNPVPNIVNKILIVYYSQAQPEWFDVQDMISRLETSFSNHADSNDYFGSPILAITGQVEGYAQKGEQGKILQMSPDATANYLALSSEPASIKMEDDNLERFIYTMSQTPDINFQSVKGIGNLSGVALKLMFLDAHIAVKCKEEIYGIGLQRRVNIIKAVIGKVLETALAPVINKTKIVPVITPYLPDNETEMIDNLCGAVTGGIMSKKTAVERNPLVTDPERELDQMEEEENNQPESTLQNVNNLNNQNREIRIKP